MLKPLAWWNFPVFPKYHQPNTSSPLAVIPQWWFPHFASYPPVKVYIDVEITTMSCLDQFGRKKYNIGAHDFIGWPQGSNGFHQWGILQMEASFNGKSIYKMDDN